MIEWIQIKEVLRNKRFLMFTIFIPACWYIILAKFSGEQHGLHANTILGLAALIGIIGNSLTTFSKRISGTRHFFEFQTRVSEYSQGRYLFDQLLVQTLLNLLIFVLMLLVGIVLNNISINKSMLVIALLSIFMGWYFSAVGFFMGFKLKAQTLDAASFPVIIFGALTIVPFSDFHSTNTFLKIIIDIQKVFPGYYYNKIIDQLSSNKDILTNISMLLLMSVITLLPFLFFMLKSRARKSTPIKS
ncbi:MAG: hypothetical protein K0R18_2661 [Bacillales bacterium]|nr:hypothetical protein [Bacillales bacterium]